MLGHGAKERLQPSGVSTSYRHAVSGVRSSRMSLTFRTSGFRRMRRPSFARSRQWRLTLPLKSCRRTIVRVASTRRSNSIWSSARTRSPSSTPRRVRSISFQPADGSDFVKASTCSSPASMASHSMSQRCSPRRISQYASADPVALRSSCAATRVPFRLTATALATEPAEPKSMW